MLSVCYFFFFHQNHFLLNNSLLDVEYWLSLTNYYQWPHVIQFETLEELSTLLSDVEENQEQQFKETSHAMQEYNAKRDKLVAQEWSKLMHRIFTATRRSKLVAYQSVEKIIEQIYDK